MPKNRLSCPYIFQRKALFGFRWTCSPLLASIVGRKELRRTLGTAYRTVAARRAIEIAAKIAHLEAKLESIAEMRDLRETNLLTVLNHYFHSALADSERWRTHSNGLTPADVAGELAALEFMARDTAERLQMLRSDEPPANMAQIAMDAGFEPPATGSEMARELARGILRTDARLIDVELRRTRGDYP